MLGRTTFPEGILLICSPWEIPLGNPNNPLALGGAEHSWSLAICRSFRIDCAILSLSTSLLHCQGGGCVDGKRVLLLGRALPKKLGIQEAEFIFLDRCFAVAVSYSAHGVWEPVWESDMVNNLLFKAVEITGLIGKLPHGNLKSSWVSCVIRAEFAARPLGVTSPPGESRCCRVMVGVLFILPVSPRAVHLQGKS